MPHPAPIRIDVLLAAPDYRAHVQAARIIARTMKSDAPTAATLIEAQLTGRDATGVADDYLDSIGWPPERGRVVTLRQCRRQSKRKRQVEPSQGGGIRLDLARPSDLAAN